MHHFATPGPRATIRKLHLETTLNYEDYENLTEADFEGLPPLVAEGQDRAQVLNEVVEKWATQTHDLVDETAIPPFDSGDAEKHPATLRRVDLRDDNPEAKPIDLGRDLLKPLADRLNVCLHGRQAAACLWGCLIHEADARGIQLLAALNVRYSHFRGKVNFSKGIFNGNADFRQATFNTDVSFREATFNAIADFDHAAFKGNAEFSKSAFNRPAYFREAAFNGWAYFRGVESRTRAEFRETAFNGNALFHQARFNGFAMFDRAGFSDSADFYLAAFSGHTTFNKATFNEHANFVKANFIGIATFRETAFSQDAEFSNADLRRGKVAHNEWPARRRPYGERQRLGLTDWLNWRRVRAIGELTALTRVSYLALVGVPLLAGLWAPARAWIVRQNEALQRTTEALGPLVEKLPEDLAAAQEFRNLVAGLAEATLPETMPVGWLLAFLAAFAVVLGQLIYQLFAPELIRNNSEDALVAAANEVNRQDKTITDERLRQAVDHLHTAANLLPHRRSAWFVTRQRRTVWIPNDVDEHFSDAQVEDPEPSNPIDGIAPEDQPTPMIKATDQEVDPEDRKRIAIEEGQKARYAAASFETRSAAWLSGGCYFLAGWLLLMIVLRQLGHIAEASPAQWLAWMPWLFTRGWWMTGVAVLIACGTALGALGCGRVGQRKSLNKP